MLVKQKRLWSLTLVPLLVLSIAFVASFTLTSNVSADYTVTPGEKCDNGEDPARITAPGSQTEILNCPGERGSGSGTADASESQDEETCAIDKIGWILCPLIDSAATISDKAFDLLADNFLRTDPELFSDSSGTRVAWEIARNLANIMFIIAFLFIIISQVTSFGISNYGIKKMLPRLIVAALAVNVSYFVCQAAVDITNILGYEVQNALANISNSLGPSVFGDAHNYGADEKGGGFLTALAWGILGTAVIVWMILAPLGAVIMLAIITVITIIIILLLRKAVIVLLIVVSPIAFVLYLLPNTEKFFSKWLSMFGKILMVFPVVGLLFGAGQLASTIVIVSGAQTEDQVKMAEECNPNMKKNSSGKYEDDATQKFHDNQSSNSYTQSNCGGGAVTLTSTKDGGTECGGGDGCKRTVSWTLGLVAAGIAIAPLIAVWSVLKGALSAAGAIGGKITSAVSKGVASGGNSAAGWAGKNTAIGRGMAARKAVRESYKTQKFNERMSGGNGLRGGYTRFAARGATGNLGRLSRAPGSWQAQDSKLTSSFAGAALEQEQKESREQEAVYKAQLLRTMGKDDGNGNIADDAKVGHLLEQAIINGDKAGIQAATNMLMNMGGPGKKRIRDSMNGSAGTSDSEGAKIFRNNITTQHSGLKSSDADVYAAASDEGARGLAHHSGLEGTYKGLTNDEMASQSNHSLGSTGAGIALNNDVQIIDEKGNKHIVKRGAAVLASKAGDGIKGTNRDVFERYT